MTGPNGTGEACKAEPLDWAKPANDESKASTASKELRVAEHERRAVAAEPIRAGDHGALADLARSVRHDVEPTLDGQNHAGGQADECRQRRMRANGY